MATSSRSRVFLDVSIGEEPAGRLTIELFTDHAPRTAENFRQFCTGEHDGLSYAKTPFHRVIDEFMIQGGDIEKGDGTGIVSIFGKEFEDESLGGRDIDAAGLVCSANRGKDTNGSQFFITLTPSPQLTQKNTVFGRVVAGEDTLRRIAEVDVENDTYRPLQPVLVSRCGELEKRKKHLQASLESSSQVSSHDRGRRRGSDSGDVRMENSPVPTRPHQHRRTSDNAVDEGLRGRPRQRSGSHSQTRPLSSHSEEQDSDSDRSSPTKKHKRKRSTSPSRHGDGTDQYERRRRRSLPNQYENERRNGRYEDEARYKPSPRRDDYRHLGRRRDDRYRPSRDRNPEDDGRIGGGRIGGGDRDDYDPPVKFKGRGVMKYRDPDRAW